MLKTALLHDQKPDLHLGSLTACSDSGQSVKLTTKEFQILSYLVQAHPRGVPPVELRSAVWGNLKVVPKALDVHLFKLRRKLNLIGWGVRFEAAEYHLIRM